MALLRSLGSYLGVAVLWLIHLLPMRWIGALGAALGFEREEDFVGHPVSEVVQNTQMHRVIQSGKPFYFLPDMDFGARDAVFSPFFGVRTATITTLPRLARLTGAAVIPVVTRQVGKGYVVRFYPEWKDFPTGDIDADVRRMNAFIEDRVREMPEQYFWAHKRFKTRPPGERSPYERTA